MEYVLHASEENGLQNNDISVKNEHYKVNHL